MKTAKWFDWFFLLRPTLIFPLWTMILIGFKIGLNGGEIEYSVFWWFNVIVGFTGMFGVIYLVNQWRDRHTDSDNRKLLLTADSIVSTGFLLREITIVLIIVLLTFFLSENLILLAWGVGLVLVGGVLYSLPPIQLQKHWWGGILVPAVGASMLCILGSYLAGADMDFHSYMPYIIAFTAGALITTIPDKFGDEKDDKITFAVRFGSTSTRITAGFLYAAAGFLGLIQLDWVIISVILLTFPVMIFAIVLKSDNLAVRTNKLAIFILSIAIGLSFPIYLLIIGIYFPFAKWYYRKRFNVNYPSFGAD